MMRGIAPTAGVARTTPSGLVLPLSAARPDQRIDRKVSLMDGRLSAWTYTRPFLLARKPAAGASPAGSATPDAYCVTPQAATAITATVVIVIVLVALGEVPAATLEALVALLGIWRLITRSS